MLLKIVCGTWQKTWEQKLPSKLFLCNTPETHSLELSFRLYLQCAHAPISFSLQGKEVERNTSCSAAAG